ncbi:hypothetical protein ACFL13_01320 [Patescibacteria group bacterium]
MPVEISTIKEIKEKHTCCSHTLFLKIFCIFLILVVVGAGAFIFYFYQNYINSEDSDKAMEICSIPEQIEVLPEPEDEYSTANLGAFSFEYPIGWHVGDIWPQDLENMPISTWIDPKPINTAPRGGPAAAIAFNRWIQPENPDELLAQKMEEAKDRYEDLSEEVIETDYTTVYHYSGTENIFEEDMQSEVYVFTMETAEGEVTIFEVFPNFFEPDYKDEAGHVATSFKPQ